MAMNRIRCEWTGGGVVGGGLSTFYTSTVDSTVLGALAQFFTDIKSMIPPAVTISIPGSGEVINEATGAITGFWSASAPSIVVGTASGTFASGVGARVSWNTSGIVNGRRVKGSTFLVPLYVGVYEGVAQLGEGVRGQITTAADDLIATLNLGSCDLLVWSRPVPATEGGPEPRAGSQHVVIGGSCPDEVSWLRTRRT